MTRPALESLAAGDVVAFRSLGLQEYEPLWRAMQRFTDTRDERTADEIWFTEHPPVYTLGVNASREHLLAPGGIPVVQIDRGGQVTYHGPGQLMIYPLIDLRRAGLGVRALVTALEQTVVDLAADYGVSAAARADAPGVYVDGVKLASVGLRIRRGASYHGMALNVDVDLEPFSRINPCGFRGLEVTTLCGLGVDVPRAELEERVLHHLLRRLGMDRRRLVRPVPATVGSESGHAPDSRR
ncbi:MAG: lipoyl(octanoyl) transferase LipB [Gammaproteobacteria bacterium]|nr:lipoyl(octanoyl) transferase LipB [Gammaproteobacteria bacterium]MDH4254431.1 lipoyl(octanoyl) transferase LipB [Gammaproteobacteria bacterium]MDH5311092.1 lipoyl(octanoyl) transferase LipB [Gammaproteobacteria bacterium]